VRSESGQRMAGRDRMPCAQRVGAEHMRGGARTGEPAGRRRSGARQRGAATMLARRPVRVDSHRVVIKVKHLPGREAWAMAPQSGPWVNPNRCFDR
jgi:hypothetical protein